jgi:chromosome segregation ATPase
LEERDNKIAELSVSQAGKGRRKGGDADGSYYEQENRTLREKIDADAEIIEKLREELATSKAKVQSLSDEKAEQEKRIRAQTKRIEDLERDNNQLTKKSQSVEERHKEVNKQKSENIRVAQQMAQENEVLREEVSTIEYQYKYSFDSF